MDPNLQQPRDILATIAALLRSELGLPETPPRVFIYNGNWPLSKETWMFLVVGLLHAPTVGFGQGYATDPTAAGAPLVEQRILEQSMIVTVDAFSVSTEARVRLPEIMFALQGDAAQRLSEQACLSIFQPSDFVDLSGLEASRRLNRYQTQFAVFQGTGSTRPVPSMQVQTKPYPKILVQQ